jgi:Ca-activated chloride channel family protein
MAQLAIEYHRVQVRIEDQVAVTHVDQAFRNDNDWTVEGTYIFPLPAGAAVSSFTLWIDGEPVEGEVLDREQARQIYQEIVRKLQDPALLEYVDRGAVQASIFPIEPGESRRIELEYTQLLEADHGLIGYRYPLNTEKFSAQPLEQVSIAVQVLSADPVRAVYSPTHQVDIDRSDDFEFRVGYEAADVTPDRDFELFYTVAEDEIGLNLLSFRDPESEDPDGTFLLLVAPSVQADPARRVDKDLILVLDQSGSMEGEKFRQAQQALAFVLDHLNPGDRFNVIAFSTGTRSYAGGLRPADEAAEARRWVESLTAVGSTDINRALLEAVAQADRERPTLVIFLTDGLPTEGVTEAERILDNLREAAPSNLRLFTFGVGFDVDTFLLDSLATEHHGAASYVSPGQSIDEAVSTFYAKVSTPVLTNLELEFGDHIVFDLYPDPLPDLFAGGQLVLVGRYRESGELTIRLTGEVNGEPQTFSYEGQQLRSSGGPEFLPRLWATRKVGALLSQIRLAGLNQELVDQIVRLSIRYGIVTPYTSYLVTEPQALGAEAQEDLAASVFSDLKGTPTAVSGEAAVQRAADEGEILRADVAFAPDFDVVKVVGTRTFKLVADVWIDTEFDPQQDETIQVPFLSEDYFQLADSRSELGAALALGPRVIVVFDGVAYEVVDSSAQGDPLELPAEQSRQESLPPTEIDPGAQPNRPAGVPCLAGLLGLGFLPLRRVNRGSGLGRGSRSRPG